MLSMVEVKCPHCGVRGQILLPPLGALIVGPCPNCDQMVVVFCGKVLALDKEIMLKGTATEKHEHLMGILVDFLANRVARVVEQLSPDMADGLRDYAPEAQDSAQPPAPEAEAGQAEDMQVDPRITDTELDEFVHSELPRLDNKDYFKAIFD